MPVGVIGIEVLVGPELTFLVEVAAVLCVGYLISTGVGVYTDSPLALLWLCVIDIISPDGLVACAVGRCVLII